MSKRALLKEAATRRMMKLANIDANLSSNFINEIYNK